ncbi:MAG: ribonuclease III [Dethiobacter sp.]|nr:MAG: ribonuclease III [Dethiobacter sp.]
MKLLEHLQWPVQNEALYQEALTHSSYAYETEGLRSNERLEFLGDAVLELVISEYFFKAFPGHPEGKLTLMRHNVVNEKCLAQIAQSINLGLYLKLGKGELLSGGSEKMSVLADALEALIGALFLDLNYLMASSLIIELFKPVLEAVERGDIPLLDYKTMLQESCQSRLGKHPVYQITAEFGPPHDRTFEAVVKLENKEIGRGGGKSKKEAEQSAAKAAWESLNI